MDAYKQTIWFHGLAVFEIVFFALVFVVLCLIFVIIVTIVMDALQHEDAIRHNYPFIGRFRNWFLHMGTFFRAYFFTEDREEMPFNRADRGWVYHASKNKDMTSAFGSTRIIGPGSVLFANAVFCPLFNKDIEVSSITFGAQTPNPYTTQKFFHISAMSFGALSAPAVLALSMGAKMAGIFMDTGEGGLAPYHTQGEADLVAEIGTAKYGYRTADGRLDDEKLRAVAALAQVKMFSIKLSQGAKPGEGGILPAAKVTPEIAKIRGIPVNTPSFSPARWPEISNITELLDMIDHIRTVTKKPVGFKFVMGAFDFMPSLCQAIYARGVESAPDFIILDSMDGGTGAAPMGLMDYVGLHIRETLPRLVNVLIAYDLKTRIKVGVSGKLINPAFVAMALAAGADYVNSARGFMFSLGCIQAMRCNKDTCPTGITTHKRHLQAGLDPRDKKVRVMNYANNMHEEVAQIARSCGHQDPRQLSRRDVRIVQAGGVTVGLEEIWPYPEPGEALMHHQTREARGKLT